VGGGVKQSLPAIPTVTRITVVDETGRVYERWDIAAAVQLQDDGRTLKIFVGPREV
jgi:hypothetical protein